MATAITANESRMKAKQLVAAMANVQLHPNERIKKAHELIDLYAPSLMNGMPRGCDGRQMIELIKQHLKEKPDLIECTPDSLISSIKRAMLCGFEMGGPRPDCYVVPFNTKLKLPGGQEMWRKVATCMESYRGLTKLVANTGRMVRQPVYHAVYEGESFNAGTREYRTYVDHAPDVLNKHRMADNDDKIVAFYCVYFLADGPVVHWMPRAEVDAIRDKHSKGHGDAKKNSRLSTWDTHYKEMGFKSVSRQMIARGMLPVSYEDARAMERAELIERAELEAKTIDAVDWSVIEDVAAESEQATAAPVEQLPQPEPAKPEAAPKHEPEPGSFGEFVALMAAAPNAKAAGEIRDRYQFDGELAQRANEVWAARKTELRAQAAGQP